MKKVIIAILLCVSLLTVPSCSLLSKIISGSTAEDTEETDDTEDTEDTTEEVTEKTKADSIKKTEQDDTKNTTKNVQPTKDTSGNETGTAQNGDITVDEQVIVDQGGIKVTLKSLDMNSDWGPTLSLLLENSTDKSVSVQASGSSVNGIMLSTWFSSDIVAGKKSNEQLSYMQQDLDTAGIKVIKDIELYFNMYDTETWDTIFNTEMIQVTTSADPSYIQKYDTSGNTVFDQDGFKIIVRGMDMPGAYGGADVYFYIENNSDKNVNVSTQNVSIDGFMIDPYFSCEVFSGKKAYATMSFMEEDLTKNDIKKINAMDFDIIIYDEITWESLAEAKAISVTF